MLAKKAEIEANTIDAAWMLVDGFVLHNGSIFVPTTLTLWPQLLEVAHGTGNKGVQKTLHSLCASFYNPHTTQLVRDHV